jgi:hypothetical protein
MAVNYESPIAIPQIVAMGVQSVLSNLNSFKLTDNNFDAFVEENQKSKLVMWREDDGTQYPCTAEQLKPFIGFRWSWQSNR